MSEGGRGDDRDITERIERQKISVTRDNHVSMSTHRKFQKLVVTRITASGDPLGDGHQLGTGQYAAQVIEERRNLRSKLRSLQDQHKLLLGGRAFEQAAMICDHLSVAPGHDAFFGRDLNQATY